MQAFISYYNQVHPKKETPTEKKVVLKNDTEIMEELKRRALEYKVNLLMLPSSGGCDLSVSYHPCVTFHDLTTQVKPASTKSLIDYAKKILGISVKILGPRLEDLKLASEITDNFKAPMLLKKYFEDETLKHDDKDKFSENEYYLKMLIRAFLNSYLHREESLKKYYFTYLLGHYQIESFEYDSFEHLANGTTPILKMIATTVKMAKKNMDIFFGTENFQEDKTYLEKRTSKRVFSLKKEFNYETYLQKLEAAESELEEEKKEPKKQLGDLIPAEPTLSNIKRTELRSEIVEKKKEKTPSGMAKKLEFYSSNRKRKQNTLEKDNFKKKVLVGKDKKGRAFTLNKL